MTSFCPNFNSSFWLALPILAASLLASCDDGHVDDPVYVDDTKAYSVRIIGTFNGMSDWNDDYQVVLAGYDDESAYSLIQKNIQSKATDGQTDTLTLNRIPLTAKTIEISVANVLRQRQATIYSYEIPDGQDPDETMTLEVGDLDLSHFGAVDAAVFQGLSCYRCHQGSEPPAGLNLTTAEAKAHLINVQSSKEPDQTLVIPGDADNSFIVKVLTDGDANVHYDHRPFFVEDGRAELLTLIKAWINSIDTQAE